MSDEVSVEGKNVRVEWMYPNIYPGKGPLDRVKIDMYHVRASSLLTIEFDSERDGFVIRMDRTKDMGGYMEVVERDVEVAFVPAWLEET